jgi:hypothetical protein
MNFQISWIFILYKILFRGERLEIARIHEAEKPFFERDVIGLRRLKFRAHARKAVAQIDRCIVERDEPKNDDDEDRDERREYLMYRTIVLVWLDECHNN